jgi:hypothetical protein
MMLELTAIAVRVAIRGLFDAIEAAPDFAETASELR